MIKVQALDCEFAIPGDYIVQARSEGTEFYRSSNAGYGRISLRSLTDAAAEPEPAAKPVESAAAGHLKIIRYVVPARDSRLPDFNYTVVRGLSDQMSGDICCDEVVNDSVKLKVIRDGDTMEMTAPVPPNNN